MADDKKSLGLLFQRPLEPIYTKSVPSGVQLEFQSFSGDNVQEKDEIPLLDLSFASALDKKQPFSFFINEHKKIACQLIDIFMNAPDWQTFRELSFYTRSRLNPFLFQYCYAVALLHREDTADVPPPPSVAEIFPCNFVEPSAFRDARAVAFLQPEPKKREFIRIERNYTASDRLEEQRLAYFREDIGVNMHHWHWHLVYPAAGPVGIVAKDRRGELFYYMHHQIIARYNVERYCNGLANVVPFSNLREPIHEGYFPKLLNSLNNRTYPSRATEQKLSDIRRGDNVVEIADLERWRERIFAAIDQGYVEDPQGERHYLDDIEGIDLLGNVLEASTLSINRKFYGDLHNQVHNLIASAHDPDGRHLEKFGVMGDPTTAMRDPVFYRWHGFVDDIFNKFKASLPRYDESHLGFQDIKVDYVEAKADSEPTANTLVTHWAEGAVNLEAGLDFGPNGKVLAAFTHLQNAPFGYTINVTNSSGVPKTGTCRIFLCPKADESGTALKLEQQRLLAVEMDKFTWQLQPGLNTKHRRSDESSLTIPYERTFRPVGPVAQPEQEELKEAFRFCGCGWPQHMLLPKGTPEGMMFDLFVMISDYKDDAVIQSNENPDVCGDAHSFCGLKDKLYPDKRSMGYPFDRRLPHDTLEKLTQAFSNMIKTDVAVKFNDTKRY